MFVLEDGRAALRTVRIDHRDDLRAEVVEGLEPGARVVLHPSDRVADGVPITPRSKAVR